MRTFLVLALIVTMFASGAASAGRIGDSPYVFAPTHGNWSSTLVYFGGVVDGIVTSRFGATTKPATCRGAYPGTHGGVRGFHEVVCSTATAHRTVRVTLWIDARKKLRDTISVTTTASG